MKLSTLCLCFFLQAASSLAQAYDFIQVSGEGEIKAKPDFISLNVTAYSRAQTAQAAQKQNAKEMARLDKILKQDFKIEAKDIQTSNFQVQPQYEYGKEKPVYKGMAVHHSLRVKFRKVDEVGNLLDKLVSGESTETSSVRVEDLSFGTDQLKAMEVEALERAVANARARAQALAKASGRNLTAIRKISDSNFEAGGFTPIRSMGKMAAMDMASEAAPTQIAAGELSVKSRVQVEFEIK